MMIHMADGMVGGDGLSVHELFYNRESPGLSYDDFIILPGFILDHHDNVKLDAKITSSIMLKLPLISSPMATVTNKDVAVEMALAGGMGIIHCNQPIDHQVFEVFETHNLGLFVGAAVTTANDKSRIDAVAPYADVICIDSAQGHSKYQLDTLKYIKDKFPTVEVMCGNVVTQQQAVALCKAGANAIRVGMGPGSICTTQGVMGVGRAQATAVFRCAVAANEYKVPVIADGGIRSVGDITKALLLGASAVMCGRIFAGCNESPGTVVGESKEYRGMASLEALDAGGNKRYTTNSGVSVAQGVSTIVKRSGPLKDTLDAIKLGLRQSIQDVGRNSVNGLIIGGRRWGSIRVERRSHSAQVEGSAHILRT